MECLSAVLRGWGPNGAMLYSLGVLLGISGAAAIVRGKTRRVDTGCPTTRRWANGRLTFGVILYLLIGSSASIQGERCNASRWHGACPLRPLVGPRVTGMVVPRACNSLYARLLFARVIRVIRCNSRV